jgi:opacity protein-like surface antigen
MARAILGTTSLALAIAGSSLAAHAQAVAPISVGLAFGSSIPTGALSDRTHSGYAIAGNVVYRFGDTPLGIRADIGYTRYRLTNGYISQFQGADGGHANVTSGTLDLTVNTPRVLRLQPYLVGGGGVYQRHVSVKRTVGAQFIPLFDPDFGFFSGLTVPEQTVQSSTQTKFGLNGGAGLSIPAGFVDVFLEARYNSAFTSSRNTAFVPITVGIEW